MRGLFAVRRPLVLTRGDKNFIPFQKVVCDILCVPETSVDGYNYALGFTCYNTSYVHIHLIHTKDEAPPTHPEKFLSSIRRRGFSVEILRSNSNVVFKSANWKETMRQFDAEPTYANPYTPTENGLRERAWSIIMPTAHALMKATHAPAKVLKLRRYARLKHTQRDIPQWSRWSSIDSRDMAEI